MYIVAGNYFFLGFCVLIYFKLHLYFWLFVVGYLANLVTIVDEISGITWALSLFLSVHVPICLVDQGIAKIQDQNPLIFCWCIYLRGTAFRTFWTLKFRRTKIALVLDWLTLFPHKFCGGKLEPWILQAFYNWYRHLLSEKLRHFTFRGWGERQVKWWCPGIILVSNICTECVRE